MESAKKMARELVENRCASCVQIMPITSFYTWKEKLEETQEVMLICKAPSYHHETLQKAILKMHPYELPEVLFFNCVGAFPPYFDWMEKCILS